MGKYCHLTSKEREKIYDMRLSGLHAGQIAAALGRCRSSIYRELKRNSIKGRYLPDTAHRISQGRKHGRYRKITEGSPIYYYILNKLKAGWSPEQISGRMKLEGKRYYVCHETIYGYIYRARKGKEWYNYLAKAKHYRGKRKGRKHGSGKFSFDWKLIKHRPETVDSREIFGHWEGDTIGFSSSKYENITTLVERKTRYLVMRKNDSRKSTPVMQEIRAVIDGTSHRAWKTITFDQGSEFAHFFHIEHGSKTQVYFCTPHSPWQRGSNENTNGRIRKFLPKNSNINGITQSYIDTICWKMNNTPRKILGFLKPKEAIYNETKRFCRTSN